MASPATFAQPGVNTDARHFLRRLTFAATPAEEAALAGVTIPAAWDRLLSAAKNAPLPEAPGVARVTWTNGALRYPDTTSAQIAAMRNSVSEANLRSAEQVRRWWLKEMIEGLAPLRENLVLFFHSVIGGSSRVIDGPQALYGYNDLLRRMCFGKIPDMVEALVLDPGMIMQESYDETTKAKPSDFSASRILDNWTVGLGNYTNADTMALARALTGWVLEAPKGQEPAKPLDPLAFRSNRRTGLVPVFHPEMFDDGAKTLLGKTDAFGAKSAVRHLALHEKTANRYSKLLIRHFGIEDPAKRLEGQLTMVYRDTGGSMEVMMRELVLSEEFWSAGSRWKLVKSPARLAVGACRQLGLQNPDLAAIDTWMNACGQRLLDAPNFGGEGWPGQEAWLNPPDRLAARYKLADALFGQTASWGLNPGAQAKSAAVALPAGLLRTTAKDLLARLDPAPGFEGKPDPNTAKAIRQIIASPEYQLA